MGLIGAFIAAIAYGAGTIAQALGVQRFNSATGPLLTRLAAGWLFAFGLLLDGLGYAASFTALRELPLFLVESAVASSVAVTAILAVIVLGQRLSLREIIALAFVVAGLVMLSLSAEPGSAPAVATWVGWLLLLSIIGIGIIIALSRNSIVLSLMAGFAFAVVGIASRLLVIPDNLWALAADPTAWAIAIGGVIAVAAYGMALDKGTVTTVAAITFAVETVVPSIVGFMFLDAHVHPGMGIIAVAGFVATLGGCIALSAKAEVD